MFGLFKPEPAILVVIDVFPLHEGDVSSKLVVNAGYRQDSVILV